MAPAHDNVLVTKNNARRFAEARYQETQGNHYSFLSRPTPERLQEIPEFLHPLLEDESGVDRFQIHQLVSKEAIQFFQDLL